MEAKAIKCDQQETNNTALMSREKHYSGLTTVAHPVTINRYISESKYGHIHMTAWKSSTALVEYGRQILFVYHRRDHT